MDSLIKTYRPVLNFIFTFIGVYFVLTLCYKFYLDASVGLAYFPDLFSNLVGVQTVSLLNTLGYNALLVTDQYLPMLTLVLEGKQIAFIVEGCNGLSVIIMFISFVIAFKGKFKTTFIYVLVGSTLIYIVNLLRIVVITIAIYKYPIHQELLHSVVFPGLIYSMVFLLWMFWVKKINVK